jgi:hypothetical protein
VKYKHIGYTLRYLTLPFFCFFTKPTDQTTEPICTQDISNDADCSKEVPFGGLMDEKKFFTGEYPFPKIFKGHFTCKSKKSNNFGQVKDNRKIPKPTYTKSGSSNHFRSSTPPSVVALSTGDVTSGVKRPLAVEIEIPP